MKHIILAHIVVVFSLPTGCDNKKTHEFEDAVKIEVDLSKKIRKFSFTEFIDSMSFICLETTDESLINRIAKVISFNNKLYIFDDKQNAILCFDSNGKYISKLYKPGKGPGEYIKLHDIFININTQNLELYDASGRKMHLYDLNNNFIRTVDLGRDLIRDIIPIGNGNYLCYNYNDKAKYTRTGLWEIDSQGKFINQHISIKKHYNVFNDWNPFYYYKNQVHLFARHSNKIYAYKEGSILSQYNYFFSDQRTIRDYNRGIITNDEIDLINYSISESDRWIFASWNLMKGHKVIFTFYNKDTHEITISEGLYNDINVIVGHLVQSDFFQNEIVRCLYANEISASIDFIKSQTGNISKLITVKDTDNPVLQILHLKK